MWIRKSQQELELKKKAEMLQRFNPTNPLIIALLTVLVSVPFVNINWILLFFISFIFCYISQVIFQDFMIDLLSLSVITFKDHSTICNKCYEPQIANKIQKCKCGGTLEALKDWKWQEETLNPALQPTATRDNADGCG